MYAPSTGVSKLRPRTTAAICSQPATFTVRPGRLSPPLEKPSEPGQRAPNRPTGSIRRTAQTVRPRPQRRPRARARYMPSNQRHHCGNLTRLLRRSIRGHRLRHLISEGARTPPMRSTVSDQSNTSNKNWKIEPGASITSYKEVVQVRADRVQIASRPTTHATLCGEQGQRSAAKV